MNKKLIYFLIFVLTGSVNLKSQTQRSHYVIVKSVNDLNSSSPDTCSITAFVTSIYVCPPCPPPMQCKPCIGDHVTISDVPNNTERVLTVLTDNPKEYKIGKKYTFLIKLYKDGKGEIFEIVLVKNKK